MIEIDGKTLLSRMVESLEPLVPRIHVVTGYREELIIEHCARNHREVAIVRNSAFRTTNTAHSLRMGAQGFNKKALFLDGDLLIDQQSLDRFIKAATSHPLLLGVTTAKSEQAVFVETTSDPTLRVRGFQRSRRRELEWANVFSGSPNLLREGCRFVYECIEPELPAAALELSLFEIDTAEDLERVLESRRVIAR